MLNLSRKGVSLIALTVSMFIVLTMLSVVTFSLIGNYNKSKKIQFSNEIEMIQLAVDSYYASNLKYPVNQSIKLSGSAIDKYSDQFSGEDYDLQGYILDTIDYEKAGINSIRYGNGKQGTDDVYVVSQKTGKVYYAKGLKIGSKYYFTIDKELELLLGKSSNNEDSIVKDGIVFSESYLSDGRKDVTIKIPKKYAVIKVAVGEEEITRTSSNTNYVIYDSISDVTNTTYTITIDYIDSDGKQMVARYLVKS